MLKNISVYFWQTWFVSQKHKLCVFKIHRVNTEDEHVIVHNLFLWINMETLYIQNTYCVYEL